MAVYGKISFGIGPFGAYAPVSPATAVFYPPPGTGDLGRPSLVKVVPERVIDATQLREAIFFGNKASSVSSGHIRALFLSNVPVSGSPVAAVPVLRAKSWVGVPVTLTSAIFNIGAYILGRSIMYGDIGAALQPLHTNDFGVLLQTISPADLLAIVQTIPGADLPTYALAIASVDLGATGGGHFPVDVPAYLNPVLPVDFPTYVKGGYSGQLDLGASLTQAGYYIGLPGFVRPYHSAFGDISATLIIRGPRDLGAFLQAYNTADLTASLTTQRVSNIRAILKGFVREASSDIGAYLRLVHSEQKDMFVKPLRAVVSTHTSDKIPNLDKVSRPFYQNSYAFGTYSGGLCIITLEPIFGYFPDLHAAIYAQDFYKSYIRGFVRAAQRSTTDQSIRLEAVSPYVSINKVVLQLVPLLNLPTNLVQSGGFEAMLGSIKPSRSTSTGTADDAGFVSSATTYRFYLGTSKGLFAPPQVPAVVRIETFINSYPLPDLHATIAGWNVSNIGASISDYPIASLGGSIASLDLSHISHLAALLLPAHVASLAADITPSGGFLSLQATLNTSGAVGDISASVLAQITPLALNIVSVSTQPISDIGALINYGSIVSCAPNSAISGLSAYIRCFSGETEETLADIGATLNVLSMVASLGATVVARPRTRMRILELEFRSKVRGSTTLPGIIVPRVSLMSSLAATVVGMSHEVNITATITPYRYPPPVVNFTKFENIIDLKNPAYAKQVLVSFRQGISSYVFDAIASAVYETDQGTWIIDLRTQDVQDSFLDLAPSSRTMMLSAVSEYHSLDEAIRNAIVILCERRQEDLSASLVATGSIYDLGATVSIRSADRVLDLATAAVAVGNSPDINASINVGTVYSALLSLGAIAYPMVVEVSENIGGSITGSIVNDLAADITVE